MKNERRRTFEMQNEIAFIVVGFDIFCMFIVFNIRWLKFHTE